MEWLFNNFPVGVSSWRKLLLNILKIIVSYLGVTDNDYSHQWAHGNYQSGVVDADSVV